MMHKNIAVVFPGQGSQTVGMLTELYQQFAVVRDTYEEANDILGIDLWSLTQNGPAEILNQTVNTQPAMLVSGIACWRVLQEKNAVIPKFYAGHSLGEYSALVASEQLAFGEAVRLSRKRAESMQAAVPSEVGAMAAIIGLEKATIESVCTEVSNETYQVWPANDNAPGQIVIAGHKPAVESACQALKEQGAKRALPLPVSVPSHCPLMKNAATEMEEAFMKVNWSSATAPVIHNYDVLPHQEHNEIVTALTQQLIQPVRWVETIQYFAQQGVNTVIEVGPGKVLAGLSKRIDRTFTTKSINDMASLDDVITLLNNN